MSTHPFSQPGTFWKGNIHCHSHESDGYLSPEEVARVYREQGYDFIALTDHFWRHGATGVTDTRALRKNDFTTLLGAELHAPLTEAGEEWHLVAVGLPLDFAQPAVGESATELAARADAAGAFVGLAHPAWSGLTLDDALSLETVRGIEVFNGYASVFGNRAESWHLADMLALRGRPALAFASDDAHFRNADDAFGAWVHVRAERLDPDALLEAFKAGRFYASQGPEIVGLALDDGQIRVACSPSALVSVTGAGSTQQAAICPGLTEAVIALDPFAPGGWCRVTVVDAEGKRAWTNPIRFG